MPDAPKRAIRLIRPPDRFGVAVFSVRVDARTTFYTLREITCEIGGRGFVVHRLGLGSLYHVRVGRREDCTCECLGYLAHGRCKHILGLLALLRRGLL